jgi:signal transduction histidine kinase
MTDTTLQVLLVEDSIGDVRLLREMFTREKPDSFELTHLVRISDAELHLAKGGVDIVLLDMGLPDGHGLDTLRRAHAAAPNTPIIVLTGLDDETLAAEAIKGGAQDYLIKGQIENRALPRALRYAIERHRMQTETDLIKTTQLQFKDEFLSHVSHELRSPLNAIYQFVTILLDKLPGELNVKQQQHLDTVLKNINQLKSMINDLFDVACGQTGKLTIELQHTSLSEAIDFVVATLQKSAALKGVELSFEIGDLLPAICADPMRLRQILIILVENAIKFTPASGSVQVKAGVFDGKPDFLLLEVSDSGCGISPNITERIFERLFQASNIAVEGRKGLGLGLHICRELVTRHGGQIWVKSTPGRGSTFSVRLPVFCLRSLIGPTLGKTPNAISPVTLMVTEVSSKTGWLSERLRAEQLHAVRSVIQRCLHSDLDVLLPKMGSAGAVELFFVVAATDKMGGKAVAKRIQEELNGPELVLLTGLATSTSYRTFEGAYRTAESTQNILEERADQIQDLINEEISSRMANNAQ